MPSRFPDAVRIRTPTLTFNRLFYFALDDEGRIWFKSIPGGSKQTETIALDWRLYLDTGLPARSRSPPPRAARRRLRPRTSPRLLFQTDLRSGGGLGHTYGA